MSDPIYWRINPADWFSRPSGDRLLVVKPECRPGAEWVRDWKRHDHHHGRPERHAVFVAVGRSLRRGHGSEHHPVWFFAHAGHSIRPAVRAGSLTSAARRLP